MKGLALLALCAVAGADAFEKIDTSKYTIEVPKGWNVGKESPWGARDITPEKGSGRLGAMTAGPTTAGWNQLYQTSLFFIQREEKGTATPFKLGKTKQGFECMSFEVVDETKFAARRYTLLKNSSGRALALSVRVPNKASEKEYAAQFQHMVDTAIVK